MGLLTNTPKNVYITSDKSNQRSDQDFTSNQPSNETIIKNSIGSNNEEPPGGPVGRPSKFIRIDLPQVNDNFSPKSDDLQVLPNNNNNVVINITNEGKAQNNNNVTINIKNQGDSDLNNNNLVINIDNRIDQPGNGFGQSDPTPADPNAVEKPKGHALKFGESNAQIPSQTLGSSKFDLLERKETKSFDIKTEI